jgi:hypothetical protein
VEAGGHGSKEMFERKVGALEEAEQKLRVVIIVVES